MKAVIESVSYIKEYETKFGVSYLHKIGYNGKFGFYSSKKKDQDKFVKGKETEFDEIKKTGNKGEYITIKPIYQGKFSNYNRKLKQEQSKYSGFAVSYVKDLIIAGKINIKDWEKASKKIFDFMVELDKTIAS